jgi:hypothetical protein
MANPEHLEILKQLVTKWNVWRFKHPGVTSQLDRANLREAKLGGADRVWSLAELVGLLDRKVANAAA